MDIIKVDVPTFIRLIEYVREEVKNDEDLRLIAEAITRLSKKEVVTMKNYREIIDFARTRGQTDELEQIKKLGGV